MFEPYREEHYDAMGNRVNKFGVPYGYDGRAAVYGRETVYKKLMIIVVIFFVMGLVGIKAGRSLNEDVMIRQKKCTYAVTATLKDSEREIYEYRKPPNDTEYYTNYIYTFELDGEEYEAKLAVFDDEQITAHDSVKLMIDRRDPTWYYFPDYQLVDKRLMITGYTVLGLSILIGIWVVWRGKFLKNMYVRRRFF